MKCERDSRYVVETVVKHRGETLGAEVHLCSECTATLRANYGQWIISVRGLPRPSA